MLSPSMSTACPDSASPDENRGEKIVMRVTKLSELLSIDYCLYLVYCLLIIC
jgi:hypothetical protein